VLRLEPLDVRGGDRRHDVREHAGGQRIGRRLLIVRGLRRGVCAHARTVRAERAAPQPTAGKVVEQQTDDAANLNGLRAAFFMRSIVPGNRMAPKIRFTRIDLTGHAETINGYRVVLLSNPSHQMAREGLYVVYGGNGDILALGVTWAGVEHCLRAAMDGDDAHQA
jgi:hypothetical protein